MLASRRVVITGLGIVSAQGSNLTDVWSALRAGRSAIAPIQSIDTSKLRFHNAAEARDFDPEKHLAGTSLDLMDRFAQFAVVTAQQAISQSGLEISPELSPKIAIVTGSCIGGEASQDAGFVEVYQKGLNRVHPLTIPRTMPNAGASHISMKFGIRGPAFTISTACSSANHAIGQAFWMVRSGQAEAAITGGSEAPLTFGMLKAWEAMRVVSPDTCRPFALGRPGMVLGEGGAMMVIESLEHATARGAKILGEIVGFGMSSDAGHITSPSVEGPVAAMRSALEDAGIAPEQIGYINAHGTGTPGNDVTECRAIRKLFGAHADRLLVSSTKSMHGHALGAAGALEAAATIMALREGVIPPTANMTTQDPECDLDVVPNQAREAQVEYALSNSFAFGGLNAVVGLRRWHS